MTRESESGQHDMYFFAGFGTRFWIVLNPGSPGQCRIWVRVESRIVLFGAYLLCSFPVVVFPRGQEWWWTWRCSLVDKRLR